MNEKSEMVEEIDDKLTVSVNLDQIKKLGKIIPKPKEKDFIEIRTTHAVNSKTKQEVDLICGINTQAQPIIICKNKAFCLRWLDILAIALRTSTLIQDAVSEEESATDNAKTTQSEEVEESIDDTIIRLLDEENSEKGGDE